MPIRNVTDIRAVRRRVAAAFKTFSPGQQVELRRYGINPQTGKGIVATPSTSARHVRGTSPRIMVGGRGASKATITHELSHAYLTRVLPRAQGAHGMGTQHLIMGVAGDVIEGEFSSTTLAPKRLPKAARQFSQAIRRGATQEELSGASFTGGTQRIRETLGPAAAARDAATWKGGGFPPPAPIQALVNRPPKPPNPNLGVELAQYGRATTPQRLRLRKKFQQR